MKARAAGPSYPAAYDQVIAVTAVNKELQSYRYANRGSYIDIAAPGVAIWTALPGAMEGYHSGTSFATPYVTATLAALYPRLASKTQAEALHQFSYKDLGAPGPDPIFGQGLVVAPATCSGGGNGKHRTPAQVHATATSTSAPFSEPSSGATEQLPWLSLQVWQLTSDWQRQRPRTNLLGTSGTNERPRKRSRPERNRATLTLLNRSERSSPVVQKILSQRRL